MSLMNFATVELWHGGVVEDPRITAVTHVSGAALAGLGRSGVKRGSLGSGFQQVHGSCAGAHIEFEPEAIHKDGLKHFTQGAGLQCATRCNARHRE